MYDKIIQITDMNNTLQKQNYYYHKKKDKMLNFSPPLSLVGQ